MAWMPYPSLLRAVLNNRQAGRVTGWARFIGIDRLVLIDLTGNFGDDIKGEKVILLGPDWRRPPVPASAMRGFAVEQTGQVTSMTAGRHSQAGPDRPHFEWCSRENGRVLLELPPHRLRVVGEPLMIQRSTALVAVSPAATPPS